MLTPERARHGLVLTLSQFIFHGSVIAARLPYILQILSNTVDFEQRSSLGVSVGANVRDASCFGLWALARRYSTSPICELQYGEIQLQTGSRLQSLANDLVVAATLDPAGNIRRGASAALQEMVGRHPDEIKHGIKLVQVIDYHAIALRSRAMLEVAIDASEIDQTYWQVILNGLLSWRGVDSPDAQSRRQAADAIGRLTLNSRKKIHESTTFRSVRDHLRRASFHKVDLRHGLILALAQVVLAMLEVGLKAIALHVQGAPIENCEFYYLPKHEMAALWRLFYLNDAAPLTTHANVASFRMDMMRSSLRTDSTYEAVCGLISALASSVVSDTMKLRNYGTVPEPSAEDLNVCVEIINLSLRKTDPVVTSAAAEAAANIFRILDRTARNEWVYEWLRAIETETSELRRDHLGVIAALGAVFQYVGYQDPLDEMGFPSIKGHQHIRQWLSTTGQDPQPTSPTQILIIDTLLKQLGLQHSIEQRCTALASLTSGALKCQGRDLYLLSRMCSRFQWLLMTSWVPFMTL